MLIKNAKVLIRGKLAADTDILIENGRIAEVGKDLKGSGKLDARGALVAPGFVDIHIHGCAGDDTMDGGDAAARMAAWLPLTGVTAFLPTTMCDSIEKTRGALEGIRRAMDAPGGATVLGTHLEGPFINAARKGAQPERFVKAPSLAAYAQMVEGYDALPRVMTIAPEIDGAAELIKILKDKLALSVGHTNATAEEFIASVDAGITQVTHLFNAMTPFEHRAPGVAGAALAEPRVYAQMIADLVHLHPLTLAAAWRAKRAEKCVLITDAMAAAGMPDGDYRLGANLVQVRSGVARLEGGALAGSTLTMNRAVRNMIKAVGVPVADALRMASEFPCASIGETERGRIEKGMIADLVMLDCEYSPLMTLVGGEVAFRAPGF